MALSKACVQFAFYQRMASGSGIGAARLLESGYVPIATQVDAARRAIASGHDGSVRDLLGHRAASAALVGYCVSAAMAHSRNDLAEMIAMQCEVTDRLGCALAASAAGAVGVLKALYATEGPTADELRALQGSSGAKGNSSVADFVTTLIATDARLQSAA